MPAPAAVIDALESVIDIYLSGVRHRERAAFILCDNLAELTCKTKAVEHNHNFDTSCGFHAAWNAPGVQLPQRTLGRKVQNYRNERNNMQHGSAASTVDAAYCATAILTAVKVIDRCWGNTSTRQLQYWMRVALRVIRLYADEGDVNQRGLFEDRMRNLRWRGDARQNVSINEMKFEPGHRDYWRLAIRGQPLLVEEALNELGIP